MGFKVRVIEPDQKTKRRGKWNESMLFDIYDLAREGKADNGISKALGIDVSTFDSWKRHKPGVKEALKRGRSIKTTIVSGQTLGEYIYKRLPQRLQLYYDQLAGWEKEPNFQKRCESLFEREGRSVRQHLFLQFLVNKTWNASEACRMVGISRVTLDSWVKNDPAFAEMLQEMVWHKKNFVEGAMFRLVKKGDTAATIHAAKTFAGDRGFLPVSKTESVGVVKHDHDHTLKIEKLPVALRQQVLLALEEGKPVDDIIDAEVIEHPNGVK